MCSMAASSLNLLLAARHQSHRTPDLSAKAISVHRFTRRAGNSMTLAGSSCKSCLSWGRHMQTFSMMEVKNDLNCDNFPITQEVPQTTPYSQFGRAPLETFPTQRGGLERVLWVHGAWASPRSEGQFPICISSVYNSRKAPVATVSCNWKGLSPQMLAPRLR